MVLLRSNEGRWNSFCAAARTGLIVLGVIFGLCDEAQGKTRETQPPAAQNQHYTADTPLFVETRPAPKTAEESRRDEREASEKRNDDRDMVLWTRILTAVGFLQLLVFGYQSNVLRRTLDESRDAIAAAQRSAAAAEKAIEGGEAALSHAREASEWQLRAYVALERIDFINSLMGQQFQPVFRNGGATPAKRVSVQFNYYLDATPIGSNFDFPDPICEPARSSLAAGQERPFDGPTISGADLERVRTGTAHYYVYGWVEYNDVFVHTPRRRTEFCSKLKIGPGSWALINHTSFNGSDEECHHQPKT